MVTKVDLGSVIGPQGPKGDKGDSVTVTNTLMKSIVHGSGNSSVKCSSSNGTITQVPAFTTLSNGSSDSDDFYKKMSNYQIRLLKPGMYLFIVRYQVNSGTANKRIWLAPYVGGNEYGPRKVSLWTPGNISCIGLVNMPLFIGSATTFDLRCSPVENMAVTILIPDIEVYVLDWEGKVVAT